MARLSLLGRLKAATHLRNCSPAQRWARIRQLGVFLLAAGFILVMWVIAVLILTADGFSWAPVVLASALTIGTIVNLITWHQILCTEEDLVRIQDDLLAPAE